MTVAGIYDIHGNIDALDAVLADVERSGCQRIVIGGDVAWGPFPAETVGRIRSLGEGVVAIRGNADREVAAGAVRGSGDWVAEVTGWSAAQLGADELQWLGGLPETIGMSVDGSGEVLFCHATPRRDDEIVTAITPERELREILADVAEDVVVCGHTHAQFDRTVGAHRLVNAGSVGLPYEDAPGAYWVIVGPQVELKRSEYDYERAAARIRSSSLPDAAGFAEGVLSPQPRQETIELFEGRRAETR